MIGWRETEERSPVSIALNGRGIWHELPNDDGPPWIGTVGEQVACIVGSGTVDERTPRRDVSSLVTLCHSPWDLLEANTGAIATDAASRKPASPSGDHLAVVEPQSVFVDPSARVGPFTLIDASGGPVIVDAGAIIESHCAIHGPVSVGSGTIVRSGAHLSDGTVIGPTCRIGGEIDRTTILGSSNKQHDGFLGHSYVGEWVNLGAGTITSDLKHTYGSVRVPGLDTAGGEQVGTGRTFVGSLIGDHVKTAIGTLLMTGSVIGIGSAVAVPRPPRLVPSLTWLDDHGAVRYDLDRFLEVAATVMGRRGVLLDEAGRTRLRIAVEQAVMRESR